MLSMLKLLSTTLLLSSLLLANSNEKVENFLTGKFKQNPNINSLNVKIVDRIKLSNMHGWDAVVVMVEATLKPKNQEVQQKMIWFTDGNVITKELTNLSTGVSLKDEVTPSFKEEHYKKKNLIYGKANAKYKVAIFSDPLCPACDMFVPQAIEEMRKQPEKFAIYYYHFPLEAIHPASVELAQAAIAAEAQGIKNVVLRMYNIDIDPEERDVRKILYAFNRKMGTDLKPSDLGSSVVQEHMKSDAAIAEDAMVNSTPTIFFDGKLDKTRRMYQRAH